MTGLSLVVTSLIASYEVTSHFQKLKDKILEIKNITREIKNHAKEIKAKIFWNQNFIWEISEIKKKSTQEIKGRTK